MKKMLVLTLILFTLLPEIASSESWSGYVNTVGGSWNIYRHSTNVSFKSDQYVEGEIKAFEGPRGRVLSPYCSYFGDMDLNDVRLKQRTAALEGNYSSSGLTKVRSKVRPPVKLDIDQSVGYDIYTIDMDGWSFEIPLVFNIYKIDFMEKWPVDISASRSLEYSGKGINDRDFSGNNLDFVGTNLLYNKELSKDLTIGMELERMNATVIAKNSALAYENKIIHAERKPSRDLNFGISARTTGIADLKYQQSGPEFDRDSLTGYEIINHGDERYYGSFNMTMNLSMRSQFHDLKSEDRWLPCCYQGWTDMNLVDRIALNADGIFDCTCSVMQGVKP